MTTQPLPQALAADESEDAAQETLNFVSAKVRVIHRPAADVASVIYGDHGARHARNILFGALCLSHGTSAPDHSKILHSLRAIDRCGAYAFEAMEEIWTNIEDTAREMARECREYADDECG